LKIKAFSVKLRGVIINWHGGGSYKIQSSDIDVLVDPASGNANNRLKGNLILKTQVSLPLDIQNIPEQEIITAGEYEIKGIKIKGIQISSDGKTLKTAYRIVIDDISLGFLGDINTELNEKTLDELGEIDILFVPAKPIAGQLIKSVDPSIAIPGWGDPKIVATEVGQKPDSQEKLVIKKKDIEAEEGFRLVILKS